MNKQANVLIVSDAHKRTRIVGMKWKQLGVDNDPEFGETVFLYLPDADGGQFMIGELKSIELRKDAKVFSFLIDESIESTLETFTHYAVPTVPK